MQRLSKMREKDNIMFKKSLMLPIIAVSTVAIEASSFYGLPIKSIHIEGVNNPDKLSKYIGIKEGDTYTPAKVAHAKAIILKTLKDEGYGKSTVKAEVKPKDKGVKLNFDIKKAGEVKIEKVIFVGNKHIPSKELEDSLVNKEGGFLSHIPFLGDGKGIFVPSQLKYDEARIREVYLEHGFADVRVGKPKVVIDHNSNKATITYTIHEGSVYTMGSVNIKGQIPGVNKDELLQKLKLKPGKKFNVVKLRHDMGVLQKEVGDRGYAYAQIRPLFLKNSKKHTLSVKYAINTSNKVKIHDVIIKGNEKTLDYVIRRYVYLAPGDYFKYSDLEDSRKELQRTGFFDKVVIKPKRINSREMDIIVDVTEAKTGRISGGIGYGTGGFSVDAGLSDKNIMGRGVSGSLHAMIGHKSHDLSISFTNPRVNNSLYSLSVGAYDQKSYYENDNAENYSISSRGAWLSVGRKIGHNWDTSVGYKYNSTNYKDFVAPSGVNPKAYSSYKKSALTASVTYDNTDDYYTPREGIRSKLALEYAGVGGDAKFLKSDFKFATYYGLEDKIDYDLILRYKLHAGYIKDNGYTPVAEMYTLGGYQNGIRGFGTGSISPTYTDSKGNRYIAGGNEVLVNSIEASIPLDMITKNMRLTAFIDYGGIRNTIDSSVNEKGWVARASIGAQVEWKSPFGPINLIFAAPINKKSGDTKKVFEFNMASQF